MNYFAHKQYVPKGLTADNVKISTFLEKNGGGGRGNEAVDHKIDL